MKMTLEEKCNKQKEIIDELFSSIIKKPIVNKSYINSNFNKKIEELFKLEVSYLGLEFKNKNSRKNDVSIEFNNDTNGKYFGRFRIIEDDLFIIINTHSPNYNLLHSFSKEDRINGVKGTIKVLFHELRHLKQYLLIKDNIASKVTLRNAKEHALINLKGSVLYTNYKDNHDNFALEADANYKAIFKRFNLTKERFDELDEEMITILKTNRDIGYLIINDKLVPRDLSVDKYLDELISKDKKLSLLKKYPILNREYDSDGNRKTLKTLIIDMYSEVNRIIASNIDDKVSLINDAKELYYELIYKRLDSNNMVELLCAINEVGYDNVVKIVNDIYDYNNAEKRRKLDLLKDKLNSELKINSDKTRRNNGYIFVQKNDYCDVVDTKDYLDSLNLSHSNMFFNKILNSEAMISRLPSYGIYLLKNGSKISAKNFIEKMFIPYMDEKSTYRKALSEFDDYVKRETKSNYEVDYHISCEKVNQEYQNKEYVLYEIIKRLQHKDVLTSISKENSNYLYMVSNIDSDQITQLIDKYLLNDIVNGNEKYSYRFSENQMDFFNTLYYAANYLTNNPILNPNNINYINKLNNNLKMMEVKREIERYNNSKNQIKM